MLSARNVYNTRHLNGFLGEILLHESAGSISGVYEIPEEYITTHTGRYKAHIILEPVNRLNSLDVTLALVVTWVLTSVEVVYVDCVVLVSSGEQVTTMAELDLVAVLLLDVLELVKRLREDVHQKDLILGRDNDMETTWVECNS